MGRYSVRSRGVPPQRPPRPLTEFVGDQSLRDGGSGGGSHLDIQKDEVAPPPEHTGRRGEVFIVGGGEVGDGQPNGSAAHVGRRLGSRPRGDHRGGIYERGNRAAVNRGTDGDERPVEGERERRPVRLHLDKMHAEVADEGRGGQKLADSLCARGGDIRLGSGLI